MSIVAMNWAMQQRPDGPSAQVVLLVIADRANERGICRHADPDDIAEISRQSRATVFRRLDELERVGLLTRFLRHGERGEREYEIRLNLDARVEYELVQDRETGRRVIRLRDAAGENEREIVLRGGADERSTEADEGAAQPESQFETVVESQIETERVSPVRLGESHSCDSHKSPSKNPSPTPKAPSLAAMPQGGREEPDREAVPDTSGLEEFRRVYPESSNRPALVEALWSGLSAAERAQALRGARGLAEQRRRNAKRSVLDPARFLRDPRLFAEHARFAPADEPAPQWVALDSAQWRGRAVLAEIRRGAMPRAGRRPDGEGEGAFMRPLPDDRVLALARFADELVSSWPIVDERSARFHRWSEWLAPLGVRLVPQRERVPGETVVLNTPRGPIEGPKWIVGARVPSEWPPARSPPTGPLDAVDDGGEAVAAKAEASDVGGE
ncbi:MULTISPECIES: helix-turn-helix domain-containing protein [Rhodoplanes]|nr:helix-turn-helix domain-containing protein [Rhodoplanes serenus]